LQCSCKVWFITRMYLALYLEHQIIN
jgi:hypothetical protein